MSKSGGRFFSNYVCFSKSPNFNDKFYTLYDNLMTAWRPLWHCIEISHWVFVVAIQMLILLTTTARQFQDYEATQSYTHPKKSFKKCDGIDFDLEKPRINLFSSVYVSMYFCSHTGLLPNLVNKLFCFLCILW